MKVNCDPFALPAEKGAEWIGRGWPSLAWWGGDDHVRFLAYTFLDSCTIVPATERKRYPRTRSCGCQFLTLQLRSALVCFLPTLYNLIPFFLPIQGPPPYFSPNSLPLYCIPANTCSLLLLPHNSTPDFRMIVRVMSYYFCVTK